MNKNDGMHYAPVGKPHPVVREGEFIFAAAALDHGHIYGMCNGLIEAGATLKWVYDPDPQKVDKFVQHRISLHNLTRAGLTVLRPCATLEIRAK